jgi:hypothetical protein
MEKKTIMGQSKEPSPKDVTKEQFINEQRLVHQANILPRLVW